MGFSLNISKLITMGCRIQQKTINCYISSNQRRLINSIYANGHRIGTKRERERERGGLLSIILLFLLACVCVCVCHALLNFQVDSFPLNSFIPFAFLSSGIKTLFLKRKVD